MLALRSGAQAQEDSKIRVVPQTSQSLILDIFQSADGSRLLTHDRKLSPRLWDAKSLRLLLVLRGHKERVVWLDFSHDGSKIVTLSQSQIKLWDSRKAKPIREYTLVGDRASTAAISPDGSTLAVGGLEGSVRFIDLNSEKQTLVSGHSRTIVSVSFSPNGKWLTTCSSDNISKIWDPQEQKTKFEFHEAKDQTRWANYSANSQRVCVTSMDGFARVYSTNTGKLLFTKPHVVASRGSVGNVLAGGCFVQGNSEMLLTSDDHGVMHLFDPETALEFGKLEGHTEALREIRVSPDRSKIATYGDDSNLFVWDVKSRSKLPFSEGEEGATAGQFSFDSNSFWVGYQRGTIRSHDLKTGNANAEALGSIFPSYEVRSFDVGHFLGLQLSSGWWMQNYAASNESVFLRAWFDFEPVISPNGRWSVFAVESDSEFPFRLVDGKLVKALREYKGVRGASFSNDSQRFMTWHENGAVCLWRSADGESIKAWVFDSKDSISDIKWLPKSENIVSFSILKGIEIWNPETGKVSQAFSWPQISIGGLAVGADGLQVAAASGLGLRVYNLKDGSFIKCDGAEFEDIESSKVCFSPNQKYVACRCGASIAVWEVSSGKKIWQDSTVSTSQPLTSDEVFSHDSETLISPLESDLRFVSLATGKVVSSIPLAGNCLSGCFAMNGSRIVTLDDVEGLTIWSAEKIPRKLGNYVMLRDNGWLAYDPQGRFDASDPSDVRGAYFVKEWDEGLEAIGMDQLKAEFYEPGLLGKLLGFDRDPIRDVPKLDDLRLYPTIKCGSSFDDNGKLRVELTERDDGGVGRISILVNGKVVLTKNSVGSFEIDQSTLVPFLLPQNYLPMGNRLEIVATNADGTLTSPATTLNIGFPKELKVPEVRLHALFVGVGDYVGQAGDLKAPPTDAKALADALQHSAEALLPNKTDFTVMTTDSDSKERPTRENIKKWFADLALNSASSDIVFVFFAGHGTNMIGDKKGYFFLTSDADPGDIAVTSTATSTISGDDLKDFLSKIPASKQVVILDTCHSGAAATNIIGKDRSISGDYQRAWESIKDATGTWMLAGAASDQLSYESPNVEHGILTYALLEAIDKVTSDGLRPSTGDDYFLDVERWLRYGVDRVESLKAEVGLGGIQKPEFKKSSQGATFDLGVAKILDRGRLNLKAPRPIVILGEFEKDKEDPLNLEDVMLSQFKSSLLLKCWQDQTKHPNIYRVAGTYDTDGDTIRLKVYLQFYNPEQMRKTLETFEVEGKQGQLSSLAEQVRAQIEVKVAGYEAARKSVQGEKKPELLGLYYVPQS